MDIFLSYAHSDQEWAQSLVPVLRRLQMETGVTFFRDVDSLLAGERWEASIDQALATCSIAICLLSRSYFASRFIQEKELPKIEQRALLDLQIFPVLLEPVYLTPESALSRTQTAKGPDQALSIMTPSQLGAFQVSFEKALRLSIQRHEIHIGRSPRARYNLVIVGKTGVGKSELVNYLFGIQVAATTIGAPRTRLGFHRHDLYMGGLPTTIWDSGGLEVNNADAWVRILREELMSRGPTDPIDQWFHTVLYCVQAPGSRIEPFEIRLIQQFLTDRYTVILVMTKAYMGRNRLDSLAASIQAQLPHQLRYVYVNSIAEDLAGSTVPASGRTQLTQEIQAALWMSLVARVPARCVGLMIHRVEAEYAELRQYLATAIGVVGKGAITRHVEERLEKLTDAIRSPRGLFSLIIRRETRNTVSAYAEIAGAVEQAMTYVDDEPELVPINVKPNVPLVSSYWTYYGETMDELMTWDITDAVGAIGNEIAQAIAFPIVALLSFFGAAGGAIEAHLTYRDAVEKRLAAFKNSVEEELWKSERIIQKTLESAFRARLGL